MLNQQFGFDDNSGKLENFFILASVGDNVWDLVMKLIRGEVDDTNELGETVNKDFKPVLQITHLRDLTTTLTNDEKIELLSKVINGTFTVKQMAAEARKIRRTKIVMKFVASDFGCDTFIQAARRYPLACTATSLIQWNLLGTPSNFQIKNHKRPTGWDAWINQHKSSAGASHEPEQTDDTIKKKVLRYGSNTFTLFNNDVNSVYSLLGTNNNIGNLDFFAFSIVVLNLNGICNW